MAESRGQTSLLIGAVLVGGTLTAVYFYNRSKTLSKNFELADLTRSATADRLNITEQYKPPGAIVRRARVFARHTLQPVRDLLGSPIFVNSWWRHPKTNKAVGGVDDSGHLDGDTVDMRTVVAGRFRNDLLAKAVLNSGVGFSKMILEEGTLARPKWIHLRASKGDIRGILLRKDASGKYSTLTRQQILDL